MSDGDRRAPSADSAVPLGPPPGTRLRTLRGLAGYRCGHTGSCCRAGWPIPVEPAPLSVLRQASTQSRLPTQEPAWLLDGEVLGRTPDNKCVFLDEAARAASQGSCRVELNLGHEALPRSCRQFPRILLADGRGWHLSLSAWCGTAASLMVGPAGGETLFLSYDHIQTDPRTHLDCLDAREAWPPLLRPGVLAGFGAYDAWEARVLTAFLQPVVDGRRQLGEAAVDLIEWTDWVREWRTADGALEVRIQREWQGRATRPPHTMDATVVTVLLDDLISQVPGPWRPAAWPSGLVDVNLGGTELDRTSADASLARYLATRLIGSWVAYQGEGLRSVVASLVSAYALAVEALRRTCDGAPTIGHMTSAVRASDWILLHLLDRPAWASWCARSEGDVDAGQLVGLVQATSASFEALPWAT
jgi:hypothetical protein